MNYELAYRIGFHPWEDAEAHAPFVEKFTELLDQEESELAPPFGKALDVGTGSGIWAIQLAKRGWQVTGVDLVEKALARAAERVEQSGVDVELKRADVTALRALRTHQWIEHDGDRREVLALPVVAPAPLVGA